MAEPNTMTNGTATGAAPASDHPQAPPEGQKPIEITIGKSTYRGNTTEEVLQQLVKAQEHAAAAITDRERQIYEYRQQLERLQKPPEREDTFNPDRYYQLIGTDPLAAANYLDRYRYGVENPAEAVQYAVNVSRRLADEREVARFHANVPEFPASLDNAEALLRRVAAEGMPITAGNLEAAFRQMVREGVMKPVAMEPPKEERSRGAAAPNVTTASRGPAISDDFLAKAEAMTLEELEKELKTRGLKY